jgi:hypothetical protein
MSAEDILSPIGVQAHYERAACSPVEVELHGFDVFLTRLRLANPEITDQAIMRLYLDRVPEAVYRDSCIFHGKRGCTLDRSMRADVCNTYFCGGLRAYMEAQADPEPTIVLAGEGDKMRTSPVLMPDQRT